MLPMSLKRRRQSFSGADVFTRRLTSIQPRKQICDDVRPFSTSADASETSWAFAQALRARMKERGAVSRAADATKTLLLVARRHQGAAERDSRRLKGAMGDERIRAADDIDGYPRRCMPSISPVTSSVALTRGKRTRARRDKCHR